MEDKNFKDLFSNLGKMNIPKIESIVPKSYEMFNPNRKEYHSPEEILEEDRIDPLILDKNSRILSFS